MRVIPFMAALHQIITGNGAAIVFPPPRLRLFLSSRIRALPSFPVFFFFFFVRLLVGTRPRSLVKRHIPPIIAAHRPDT